jgi:transcriptional regulator with XRE-family HTH domain
MEKLKDLASEFGVSISTISQITRGRSRPYEGGPVLKVGVRVNAKEMKKRGSKNAERDERVVRLFRTEGRTPTEIAECCGLTRQRISQILKERAR